MHTPAFAAAAAGFLAGTAPHQNHGGDDNHHQGKELLPFHAWNIPAKANRAIEIFLPSPGCELSGPWQNMAMAIGIIWITIPHQMNEPNENPRQYRWPWLVAAAVALGLVLAVVWMGFAVKKVERERDLNAPLPSTAPVH
jgi:hypothetical protein